MAAGAVEVGGRVWPPPVEAGAAVAGVCGSVNPPVAAAGAGRVCMRKPPRGRRGAATCGMVSIEGSVSSRWTGAAVDGKCDVELAGERTHESVGDLAGGGPGWLAGGGGIEAEDEARALWHGGAGERGWVWF